ncbi:lytic transglycosylase domain-containing protein [Ditylenchus destructor]|nr:lytic transglycosylase domain-containing protein [Ditylenchus destructor]
MSLFVLILSLITFASGQNPTNQMQSGDFTYYSEYTGYGICGYSINTATDSFASVSWPWWSTSNPYDPLCSTCVYIYYNGRSVTLPIRDRCPRGNRGHLELSGPAYNSLASGQLGARVLGVQWQFVSCY